MLKLGSGLGAGAQLTVVIISVAGGTLVALTAAFFGTVIPSAVRPAQPREPAPPGGQGQDAVRGQHE